MLPSSLGVMTRSLMLRALDAAAAKLRLFYVRFMDDILILAPTRWQLRGAVKVVNQMLGTLKLEKHPDKAFIGRIELGFDFLGYHFSPAGLTLAKQTIRRCLIAANNNFRQWTRAERIEEWAGLGLAILFSAAMELCISASSLRSQTNRSSLGFILV